MRRVIKQSKLASTITTLLVGIKTAVLIHMASLVYDASLYDSSQESASSKAIPCLTLNSWILTAVSTSWNASLQLMCTYVSLVPRLRAWERGYTYMTRASEGTCMPWLYSLTPRPLP